MNKKDFRIIYMGTPEFAVEPLRTLVEGEYNIVAVVTMPDKPSGRGMKLQASPVKLYAQTVNIPVLQPEKLKDESFIIDLKSLNADLQVVVAFRMLPEIVWAMPKNGTFNLHASLLPQYRGAAPIHHAVINGEKETGATTFFLQHSIDTGDIIFQEKIQIGEKENTGSVHDKLMHLGSELVKKTVDAVIDGSVISKPQEIFLKNIQLNPAPKLTRENTRIDWTSDGLKIFNFIRGLCPFPTAWTELCNEKGENIGLKIFEASFKCSDHGLEPGKIVSDGKKELNVAVNDGYIVLERIQISGRKAMEIDEFLRGFTGISNFFVR